MYSNCATDSAVDSTRPKPIFAAWLMPVGFGIPLPATLPARQAWQSKRPSDRFIGPGLPVGMGVQPASQGSRKCSLAPLSPAPRAPVAAFGEPVAGGGSRGISKGSGTITSEYRSSALDEQGTSASSLDGWATDSSSADAISATLAGCD